LRFGRLVALLFLVILGACASDPVEPNVTPTTPRSSSTSIEVDPGPPGLERVVDGLSSPVFLTHAGDGTGDLYVVEQTGTIRVLRGGRGAPHLFLDVTDRVVPGGEQGLLGLAFHPAFEDNGRFFVNYTDTSGDTQVVEYAARGGRADEDSARSWLTVDQPFSNHNGGHVVFGPDGALYVGMGDGGSGGDPEGNGQDPTALLGKLLRIDVDGSGEPQIWALGLRNPWRFSFDEPSGRLWIGDVGQGSLEEVNRVDASERGLNYGWNEMEGSSCYEGDCNTDRFVLPVTEYDHGAGCSITGGYVYRGDDVPALEGHYVFGDYCSGTIFSVPADIEGPTSPRVLLSPGFAVSSFGVDEQNELYVVDHGGAVFRFVAST
jgi:glucose/arabinose dehydrogenase